MVAKIFIDDDENINWLQKIRKCKELKLTKEECDKMKFPTEK